MSEGEDPRLQALEEREANDPDDMPPSSEWWFLVSEEERDFFSGMSAAGARQMASPEKLFAMWRRDAITEAQKAYIEDLIARVSRHLEAGTGGRLIRREWS